MRLSIIVPVYNAEQYIVRCLDSLFNQDIEDYEVIAINDGSTDNSWEVLQEYKQLYDKKNFSPVLRIYNKRNEGVCKTRNLGIEKSRAKWVMFCDNDDAVEPNSLKNIFGQIEAKSDVEYALLGMKTIGWKGVEHIFDYRDLKQWGSPAQLVSQIMLSTFSGPWSKLYRRDILEKFNIRFDPEMALLEDTKFNMDYLRVISNIEVVKGVFYNYYVCHINSGARKFYGDAVFLFNERIRANRIDYFVEQNNMPEMLNDINRDAAFIYLFAIYSIYRKKGVKGRYGWLKKYWNSATDGDRRWSFQLDSGFPKIVGRVGRMSLPVLHVVCLSVFGLEKLRRFFR